MVHTYHFDTFTGWLSRTDIPVYLTMNVRSTNWFNIELICWYLSAKKPLSILMWKLLSARTVRAVLVIISVLYILYIYWIWSKTLLQKFTWDNNWISRSVMLRISPAGCCARVTIDWNIIFWIRIDWNNGDWLNVFGEDKFFNLNARCNQYAISVANRTNRKWYE